MLSLTDLAIIFSRLFLETASFYNAKMMYSYIGTNHISPIFTLYITHSMGTFIFLHDIFKHRSNYLKILYKETGIKASVLFLNIAFLSLFYNLCHIPKFYAMNYLSDIVIVSIYGGSVLFTYIFSLMILKTKMESIGLISLLLGILGMLLLLTGDDTMTKHMGMCISVLISSMFSGMYGVLFKIGMKVRQNKKDKNDKEVDFYEIAENNKSTRSNNGINVSIDVPSLNESVYDKKVVSFCKEEKLHARTNLRNNFQDDKLQFNKDPNSYKLENKKDFTTQDMIDLKTAKEDIQRAQNKKSNNTNELENKKENILYNTIENHKAIEFEHDIDEKYFFLQREVNKETYRKILFMKHYISLTGVCTFLFYWPGLVFVHTLQLEKIAFPTNPRPLVHLFIANIISLVHNVVYFVIVAAKTPLFAQISGIILQPTFLFISIIQNHGLTCIAELIGCVMSFVAFLMLCNRH